MFASNYAEVASYRIQDESDLQEPLPGNYKPLWKMPDPWHRKSLCHEDFVLLAEFSEIEGPKPLMTFPPNVRTSMDLNAFCVKIMSVDYQSQPGESFHLHKNSSTVMCSRKDGINAFVYHFTLYDSRARGFVRPFCAAFISSDERKILTKFEALEQEFEAVTALLLDSNLPTFLTEMTHYLSDLQFTKVTHGEGSDPASYVLDPSTDPVLQGLHTDSLHTAITEIKHILRVVSSALYSPSDPGEHQGHRCGPPARPSSACSFATGNSAFTYQYSSSATSGGETLLSGGSGRGSHAPLVRSDSVGGRAQAASEEECTYWPQLVRTVYHRRYERTLRGLEVLSPRGHKAAVARLYYIKSLFSDTLAVLDLARGDEGLVEPSAGLLAIGGNVYINFLSTPGSPRLNGGRCGSLDEDQIGESAFAFSRSNIVFSSSLDNLKAFCDSAATMRVSAGHQVTGASGDSQQLNSNDLSDSDVCHNQVHPPAGSATELGQRATELGDLAAALPTLRSLKVFSITDTLGALSMATPGIGMLKLVRHFSFSPHLMYSLLIGRPVVVLGSKRKAHIVQEVMKTLLFLVPGAASNSVSTKPLDRPLILSDLEPRLLGVVRPGSGPNRTIAYIPSELESYCTALDMDRRALYGPVYPGGLLTGVCAAQKYHHTESSYLAYIHSVLMSLTLKAYIFYHTFVVNVSSKLSAMYSRPTEASAAYRKAQQHFCNTMGIGPHDSDIVKHLAEVIQAQIEGKVISLDAAINRTCTLFKS